MWPDRVSNRDLWLLSQTRYRLLNAGRPHRMNTEGSIFTSGENTTFAVMSEKKDDLTLVKSNFLFRFCFKLAII